ncbi:polymorphic toxin type 46 domain-containing protein [Aeromonas caviae]|uniref:polymorphic toxin type 46 domain-containing protein n=1 Tax=Aeromonas caviae TaxID=648 RepID=UPI0038D140A2
MAFDFYKGQGVAGESMPSHLNGIDYSHDVRVETLNRGKKVYQHQSPGAPQGNYYALHCGVTSSELGIGKMG